MSTHNMFSWRNNKNIYPIPTLIQTYVKVNSIAYTGNILKAAFVVVVLCFFLFFWGFFAPKQILAFIESGWAPFQMARLIYLDVCWQFFSVCSMKNLKCCCCYFVWLDS